MLVVNKKKQYFALLIWCVMEGLGDRIKEARNKAGLTQPQLCRVAGIARRTLVNIEGDASKTSLQNVHNIARSCGVSLQYLVYGEENPLVPCAVFQDQAKGEALIKKLQDLEKKAPHIYDMVGTYIAGTHDAVKAVAEDWQRIAPTEEKKQQHNQGLGESRTGTDSS